MFCKKKLSACVQGILFVLPVLPIITFLKQKSFYEKIKFFIGESNKFVDYVIIQ